MRVPRWRPLVGTLTVVCLLIALTGASGQENSRAQLFREADASRARAKDRNADVYAPKNFTRGMDAYLEAQELLRRGRPVDEIQERVRSAVRYFTMSEEASKSAESLFAPAMAARNDAMSADAMRSSAEIWTKAEALMRSAATSLEEGNPRAARDDAGEAQGLYRQAELEAIKANFLAPARQILARADELKVKSTAPQTLERARKLANLAEAMIQQNRYDNAEARRLAEEASYEAAHAIYLHQVITQLQAQGRDLEDAILLSETNIAKIAQAMNLHLHFDAGIDPAVQRLVGAARTRDSVVTRMTDSLRIRRAEVENMRRRIGVLESRSIVAGGVDQIRKNEEKKKHDQTVALASILFTAEDGVVLHDGSNVVLRICGLEFAPGKSIIEPQFSGLLSKVLRAIRMFPNCQLTIEGHTEAGGSETANQRISEARAEAVAGYLRSSLPPSTPILSQGYGSSRPTGDNSTAEGRAHNRRIDILIVPEWAIVGR